MKALLISGDALRAHALRSELFNLPAPVFATIVPRVPETPLDLPSDCAGCVIDLTRSELGSAGVTFARLRTLAPTLPIAAIVSSNDDAVAALAWGADGVGRVGPRLPATLADILARPRLPAPAGGRAGRILYLSLHEPVRDRALLERFALDVLRLDSRAPALPPALDLSPHAVAAIVIDMAHDGGALAEVLLELAARDAGRRTVVLVNVGDRHLPTLALRLGVRRLVAKAGAWPARLLATLEDVVGGDGSPDAGSSQAVAARLHTILESLPAGVLLLTDDGRVLAANAAAVAVTGLGAEDFDRQVTCVADHARSRFESWLRDVATGLPGTVVVPWRRRAGPVVLELAGRALPRLTGPGSLVLATVSHVPADDDGERYAGPAADSVPLERHAAVKAHLDQAAREAALLREQVSVLEAERAATARQVQEEIARLTDALVAAAVDLEVHDALLQATEEQLRAKSVELAEARRALARARGDSREAGTDGPGLGMVAIDQVRDG